MSTTVMIKWSGKVFHIPLQETDTVNTLKRKVHTVKQLAFICAAFPSQIRYTLCDLLQIEEQTAVLPKRQKLIGLKAKGGKPANDDLPVSDLTLKEGQKIMMMGQPEAHVEAMDKQSEVRRSWQNLAALLWPHCRLQVSAVAGEAEFARPVTARGCDAPSAGGTVTKRSL